MAEKPSLESISQETKEFIEQFDSAVLATVNTEAVPEASYAPVLQLEHRFYIYVSELAKHTQNLLDSRKASLLFIESEKDAHHLFARKRLTLRTLAQPVQRHSDQWHTIMDRMESKFGDIIQMLKTLEDFHLFELTPESANYVRGFAQAYTLSGENLSQVSHQNDRGHGEQRSSEN